MKGRVFTTGVALTLAVTATLAVFLYVRGIEDDRVSGPVMVDVIVAKDDVPAGTHLDELLAEGAFETRSVPEDMVVEGAVTDLTQLEGEETAAAILAGEQISTARLQGSGELPGGALGIPAGHQAVTLAVNAPQGAGAALRSNDQVMVYATFDKGPNGDAVTMTLVPNVEVLKVTDTLTGDAEATGNDELLVTMALKPREAQKVVFAQQEGTVYFGLQPPGEESQTAAPISIFTVGR